MSLLVQFSLGLNFLNKAILLLSPFFFLNVNLSVIRILIICGCMLKIFTAWAPQIR